MCTSVCWKSERKCFASLDRLCSIEYLFGFMVLLCNQEALWHGAEGVGILKMRRSYLQCLIWEIYDHIFSDSKESEKSIHLYLI